MREWGEPVHGRMGGLETNGDGSGVEADTGGWGQTFRLRDVSEISLLHPLIFHIPAVSHSPVGSTPPFMSLLVASVRWARNSR